MIFDQLDAQDLAAALDMDLVELDAQGLAEDLEDQALDMVDLEDQALDLEDQVLG
jgi:hypothetical protein